MENNYVNIVEAIESLEEFLEIEKDQILEDFTIEKFIDDDSDGFYYIATPTEKAKQTCEKYLIVPNDTISSILNNYSDKLIEDLDLYISDKYLCIDIDLTNYIDLWKIQLEIIDNVNLNSLIENYFPLYIYNYTNCDGCMILNEI